MKLFKYGLYLFTLLFPYLIILAIICIFTNFGNIMELLFNNNALYVLATLMIIYVFALVCTIIQVILNIRSKISSKQLLFTNMMIKLIHIPAYIVIFLFGVLNLITIFTIGISIILMILDGMTIFLTGLIGLSGIIRGLFEKKLSPKNVLIYGIFQFIFCIDVISSIFLYKKIKNNIEK